MKPVALETRKCGQTGLDLPILGVGVWMFGGTEKDYWGGYSESEARDLIDACLDSGANYFDGAEAYNDGRSEEALGKILAGRRERAVIGTKILPQNCGKGNTRKHCEASLRRLGTDYIDIYMIHWPVREVQLEETLRELQELRDEGKIRVIGVSNFGVKDMTAALAIEPNIGINQMHYNLLSRAIEVEVLPLCRKHNVGIMTYMSLLQGILTGKYHTIDDIPTVRTRTRHFRGDRPESRHGEAGAESEVNAALSGIREVAEELNVGMGQLALAWLAAQEGISCVLAGARDRAQLQSNIQGVIMKLSSEVQSKLDEVTRPLLTKLGPDPDYWQSGANSRIR